jgi:hypothetical protein
MRMGGVRSATRIWEPTGAAYRPLRSCYEAASGVRPGSSSFDGGIPKFLLFCETSRSSHAIRSVNPPIRMINCQQNSIGYPRDGYTPATLI